MAGASGRATMLSGRHDVELASLAAMGERAAFSELARRHGGAVRALLRRLGADNALADDMAQDAFLIAYQQIADFRGEGAFAAWVRRIAARLYLKRRRRDARVDLTAETPEPQGGLSDAETGPIGRMDLDQALACLTPAERLCVSLCHGAGFSHAELAEALNAPLGTVKSHVKRGLDKLRVRLSDLAASDQEAGR